MIKCNINLNITTKNADVDKNIKNWDVLKLLL